MWPWGQLGALAALCSALAGIMGCCCLPAAPLKPSDMVGTYEGDYGNGYGEVLALKANGTFEQVFSKDGQQFLRVHGTWNFDAQGQMRLEQGYTDMSPWEHAAYTPEAYRWVQPLEATPRAIIYSEWPTHRLKRVPDVAKPEPAAERATSPAEPAK